MRHAYLWLSIALFLFSACNQPGADESQGTKPIVDTTAGILLRDFETTQQHAGNNCVDVVPTDKGVPADKSPQLLAALQRSLPAPQQFTINAAQPAEIKGAQGTRVSFSPGCFVDAKGRIVKEDVQLELRECYTLNDMLRHHLNTSIAGSPVESKGIISILAFYKGNELKLKEGEQMQVEFPWNRLPEGYNFSYGTAVQDEFNWLPAEDYLPYASLPTIDAGSLAGKPLPPSFSYQGLNLAAYLKEFITYPEEARRNELSSSVDAVVQLSAEGKVEQVNAAAAYKIFREDLTLQLLKLPKFSPATYAGRNIPCSIHVWLNFDIRGTDQIAVKADDTEVTYYYHNQSATTTTGTTAAAGGNYNRSFSRLGWISCGRFLNTEGPKADVIVRSDANSSMRLVLKGFNSIVQGEGFVGYTRFRNVPVGTPVFVFGVQQQGNQANFSLEERKLEKQTIVTPVWKNSAETSLIEVVNHLTANS